MLPWIAHGELEDGELGDEVTVHSEPSATDGCCTKFSTGSGVVRAEDLLPYLLILE